MNRGSILISVLIFSTLIAYLTLRSYMNMRQSLLLRQDSIHSKIADLDSMNSLLGQLSSAHNPDFYECVNAQAKAGKFMLSKETCILTGPAPSIIHDNPLPLLNYTQIFSGPSACEVIADENNIYSFELSPSALIAGTSCLSLPPSEWSTYILRSNLVISDTFHTPNNNPTTLLLAASGYIDLQSSLLLQSNLIILAGGDLHIQNIQTDHLQHFRLSLFSASGKIIVDNVEGNPLIYCTSRLGSEGPFACLGPIQESPDYSLLPELTAEVLGVWEYGG